MKTINKLFIALAGTVLFYACSTQPANDFKNGDWIIGTWQNITPEGTLFETWKRTNDKELSGMSYILNENDTMIFETIRLVQEEDGISYIPTVADQNEGLPVRFAGKVISETQFVFENPQHDFPQQISYTKIGADSLVAEISGKINGEEQKQSFSMKRVNY